MRGLPIRSDKKRMARGAACLQTAGVHRFIVIPMDASAPMQDPHHATVSAGEHSALAAHIAALPWPQLVADLDQHGNAVIPRLLAPETCAALAHGYGDDSRFRSRIAMARHGFGRGEYKYYAYPLPDTVQALRAAFYPRLVEVANRWNAAMDFPAQFPPAHDEFLQRCHAAGQLRPTPLLLRYGPDDYNCLHQDLYGEQVFPLQVAVLLSQPGQDFTGGEFVLTEQRPRMQSRPEVVPLQQGDAVIFAVSQRPVQGSRGSYRVNLRHGVSRIRWGRRFTLGVIFHDAT
jgi:uncharacterized protein